MGQDGNKEDSKMKTVIYARYSPGGNQTEQSIEGQLRECNQYAKTHDLTIVDTYIDRHITGKTDHRPKFQKMIKDSSKHLFDAVLVWKTDRFARNRYDSAIYKNQLKKNGVKVFYAKENIPDGPEGIILESMLEGMAEYYSAELSQKIRRGMRESAHKCHVTGGYLALGYKIGPDKSFEIDEQQASIVRKIFAMYDAGSTVTEICNELNSIGVKTARGGCFNKNSLRTILKNEKYIGVYDAQGVRVEDGVPAIIDKALFDRVQQRTAANRKAPAREKAKIDYYLSGKLYCGSCGAGMSGEYGTSKGGERHYYYICVNKKRLKTCDKKAVRKDWIENLIVEATEKHILQPGKLEAIAKKCVEVQARDASQNDELRALQKQLSETKTHIKNLMTAIEQGIITKTTKKRLSDLEAAQEQIEYDIEECSIKQPKLGERDIRFLLSQFQRETNEPLEEYTEKLIKTFVNSVRLFDDHVVVLYNLTNEKNELESSFLEFLSDPENPDKSGVSGCSDLELFGGDNRAKSEHVYFVNGMLVLLLNLRARKH
jgi:DNA invertase Pin-like site-specific DNA recombinase